MNGHDCLQVFTEGQNIVKAFTQVLHPNKISIREVAKLIGLMVSCFDAAPHGPLHYHQIERNKCCALRMHKGKWESSIRLCSGARNDISC